jgi:hypothetical protein
MYNGTYALVQRPVQLVATVIDATFKKHRTHDNGQGEGRRAFEDGVVQRGSERHFFLAKE